MLASVALAKTLAIVVVRACLTRALNASRRDGSGDPHTHSATSNRRSSSVGWSWNGVADSMRSRRVHGAHHFMKGRAPLFIAFQLCASSTMTSGRHGSSALTVGR
jgi:hypothetical protein